MENLFEKIVIGRRIERLHYGPDPDGDPEVKAIELTGGVMLHISAVLPDGNIIRWEEIGRIQNDAILRFLIEIPDEPET